MDKRQALSNATNSSVVCCSTTIAMRHNQSAVTISHSPRKCHFYAAKRLYLERGASPAFAVIALRKSVRRIVRIEVFVGEADVQLNIPIGVFFFE